MLGQLLEKLSQKIKEAYRSHSDWSLPQCGQWPEKLQTPQELLLVMFNVVILLQEVRHYKNPLNIRKKFREELKPRADLVRGALFPSAEMQKNKSAQIIYQVLDQSVPMQQGINLPRLLKGESYFFRSAVLIGATIKGMDLKRSYASTRECLGDLMDAFSRAADNAFPDARL